MKQQRNSCLSPNVACMALALFGFCCLLGLGLTDENRSAGPVPIHRDGESRRHGWLRCHPHQPWKPRTEMPARPQRL